MKTTLEKKVQRLQMLVVISLLLYVPIILMSFSGRDKVQKFKEINVERINVVEKDGTLKMAIFNSNRITRGTGDAKRQGEGTISGILFYNEEGYECGGLVFDGKKIKGGQRTGVSLTMDGYRQDQTIALQHNEHKDDKGSFYEDGLRIMSRPDRADVSAEYDFYRIKYPKMFGIKKPSSYTKAQIDSMFYALARQNKVATRRVFLGSVRGTKNGKWYDRSGLFIKNKYGKSMIKIYIDTNDQPKFEVMDTLGKTVTYRLIPEK